MKRVGVIAALMAILAIAATGAAQAAPGDTARVTDGATILRVDPGTAEALTDAGVGLRAIPPAKGAGTVFAFDVTGGKVSASPLGGKIRHSGGLTFVGGGERLGLKNFVVDLDRGLLVAQVVGTNQRVPVLRLSGGTVKSSGPIVRLEGVNARLTPAAADALNATFDTDLFAAGLPIGKVKSTVAVR